MGQQETKQITYSKKSVSLAQIVKKDPRLVQRIFFNEQLTTNNQQKHVAQIQAQLDRRPQHSLQLLMVKRLDQRFVQLVGQKPEVKKKEGWHQLETQERFLCLMAKIEREKQVEGQLRVIVEKEILKSRRTTIRKRVTPVYKTEIDQLLFSKLFLHYYSYLLKKCLEMKDTEEKKAIEQFHNKIGKMLCQMIQYRHLQPNILSQLAYKIISIDKNNSKEYLVRTLNEIHAKFYPIYLRKEHSITVHTNIHQKMRRITRCYLDQIYLDTLKEAEDPEIDTNKDDGLRTIRNFPITRVKRK